MLVLSGLACGAFGLPLSALATSASVSLVGLTFSPPAVTINVGDQVVWTWNSPSHSTTSDTAGLWDSGIHSAPFSFSHTFTTAGAFPYHCSNPFHTTMKGSVTVVAVANVPPTVSLTKPADGILLSAPATLTLSATASDPDGSIANVQFLRGTTSLATLTSSPYSVTVSNLAAGDYTFSAVATDNGGLSATSAITVHVVTPVPIVLRSPQRLSVSSFQFSYSASPGLSYVVFRGAALSDLLPISTNKATSSTVDFLDTNATGGVNFYGVHSVPNP
ncbi:MAG: Ig-like domain-containing protein [Verrucomicrobia bacterium]|nr:Ig-like domain-containing protein [Verrucomicrobiota bacterium]